jgi:c-di-GMP-binding flagellar brake protein YcgR
MSTLEEYRNQDGVGFKLDDKLELEVKNSSPLKGFFAVVKEISDFGVVLSDVVLNKGEGMLEKGDELMVRFPDKGVVYEFDSEVLSQKGERIYLVRAPLTIRRTQRRRYVRLDISAPVSFRLLSLKEKDCLVSKMEHSGVILNIGGGGILLVTKRKLEEGDFIIVDMNLEGCEVISGVLGRVKRSEQSNEDEFLVGVEFCPQEELEYYLSSEQIAQLPIKVFILAFSLMAICPSYAQEISKLVIPQFDKGDFVSSNQYVLNRLMELLAVGSKMEVIGPQLVKYELEKKGSDLDLTSELKDMLEVGKELGGDLVLWGGVDKREVTLKRGFSVPYILTKYQHQAEIKVSLMIFDLRKGEMILAKSFDAFASGNKGTAWFVHPEKEPDHKLSPLEEDKLIREAEDKVARDMAKNILKLVKKGR